MLEDRRDQHYLRRPGNLAVRRSRWRRGLVRRSLVLALQASGLVLLGLVGRQIYLATITSARFDVATIAVRGNSHAKTADIVALAGGARARNIFTLDLESVRADVRRHPWILDASIRRLLPSTVEITVTEREPAAIARFEEKSYLVDGTGRVLEEYGPAVLSYDFPVLTGLEGLPREEGLRRLRAGASAISVLTGSEPDFAKRISEIDLSTADRLTLRLADGGPILYVSVEDPLRNLDHFAEIRSLLPHALPAGGLDPQPKIEYVDLRFRGRIAVMPRTEKAQGQQP